MIKCKLATVDGNCPKKKEICCQECDELKTCTSACDVLPIECGDSIYEGTDLEVFQQKQITAIQVIAEITLQKKDLEEKEKKMKEQLQKAMEENNLKSFENEVIKLTYVAATTATSVDSKKLKEKHPDVFTECSKTSSKSAYVKITLR